ncbi:MAG: undecaprenyl-diphosphatase UppP [Ectothiorhodospiraceae bacterium]|nr:undecaprenyl-diphosphatase UppP [Ectothiorhodospiraceae bacterium]
MGIIEAVVLGIVQGLTEFLPISSTAHLRIVPALFGWDDPGAPFSAITQIGTMAAVLFYFRTDLMKLTKAFVSSSVKLKPFESEDSRLAWYIVFGTIPIAIIGLLLKDSIETSFRSLHIIAGSLIALALILALAEYVGKRTRNLRSMGFIETQIIGLAQAVALIPGSSRSGTTITAGLFLNLTREEAARYSFLLSVPAVLLSGVYQLYALRSELIGEVGTALIVATVVSGVVGFLSIDFMLKFLRKHSTMLFIVYRIGIGITIYILLALNILQP